MALHGTRGHTAVRDRQQALSELDAEQLRQVSQRLLAELRHQRALNETLAYECALLKRLKFAAKSERHSAEQRNLLEEELARDLAAVEHEIEQLRPTQPVTDKQQPKRTPLPANLPRHEIRHEPTSTTCQCGCQLKRIGEDVAEKLDYVPGVFTVERHIRGKWACASARLTQAPVAARHRQRHPDSGLLAQVLVVSTPITSPCTARRTSLVAPIWRSRSTWRNGWYLRRAFAAAGRCLKTEILRHRVLHGDERRWP